MADSAVASGADQISALPLDIRLRSLSLLPVDEAVRTGELSREWRGLWKKMPSLHLVGLERIDTTGGFNEFVNHVIVLRGHLPLDKFKIEARISETGEPYPYANLWVKYALICKVQVLGIYCEPDVEDKIKLTVPLVSERLTTLNLCDVDLEKCSALVDSRRTLDFSSCPLLKNLKMEHCSICVDKISSKSLERLRITVMSCFNELSRTWICTPNLTSLELSNCHGKVPVLESMPFLQRAFIRFDGDEDGSSDVINPVVFGGYQSVLLNGLSSAIYLELIADSQGYIYRRDLAYCPIFGNLKTLVLKMWCVTIGIHGLVCILQHSPILEKLTLQFSDLEDLSSVIGDDGKHDQIEQTFACARLKVVNIRCKVINEWVSQTLKLLSRCGIPREHISLKVTKSCSFAFSFERASTSDDDDDVAPLSTHGDATPSTDDNDDAPSSVDNDDAPSSSDDDDAPSSSEDDDVPLSTDDLTNMACWLLVFVPILLCSKATVMWPLSRPLSLCLGFF